MSSPKNPQHRVDQEIWRASNPGSREGVIVRYTPSCAHNHVTADGTEYCGAMVKAIDGLNMTLGILFKPSMYAERTVLRSLKPGAIVGDALVVGDQRRRSGDVHGHRGSRRHSHVSRQSGRACREWRIWPAAIPPSFY